MGRRGDRRLLATGLMTVGLALWAYTTAWLTPAVEGYPPAGANPGYLHFWVRDQRYLIIGALAAALVVLRAGRGPVALPAVAVYAALVILDYTVDATGFSGWPAAVAMFVAGAAVLVAAARIRIAAGPGTASRRPVATVAISAALVTPMLLVDFAGQQDAPRPPAGLIPSGVASMALLWCAAVALASAARAVPLPRVARAAYAVPPVAAVAGAALRPGTGGLLFVTAPVLVLLAVAAVRGWRSLRPWWWLVFGAAGPLALVAFLFVAFTLAMGVNGPQDLSDGLAFMPGTILAALLVGALLARLAVPVRRGGVGAPAPGDPMRSGAEPAPGTWEPDAPPGRRPHRAPVAWRQADS